MPQTYHIASYTLNCSSLICKRSRVEPQNRCYNHHWKNMHIKPRTDKYLNIMPYHPQDSCLQEIKKLKKIILHITSLFLATPDPLRVWVMQYADSGCWTHTYAHLSFRETWTWAVCHYHQYFLHHHLMINCFLRVNRWVLLWQMLRKWISSKDTEVTQVPQHPLTVCCRVYSRSQIFLLPSLFPSLVTF